MKRNGKYRFSLQFPALSEQQVAVGEMLERLGNRKSSVIVAAVFEYVQARPDIIALYSSRRLQKKKSENTTEPTTPLHTDKLSAPQEGTNFGSSESSLVCMLDNLSLFN